MELVSKIHGIINYEEENIIEFNKGILGFEEYKKYILLDIEGKENFKLLHALENDELGFILVSPFYVKEDYEVNLKENVLNSLKIKSEEDVLLLTTLTLNSKVENITTNLCAPIVININEKLGEQIILDNDKYKIKQPLMEAKKC